MLTAIREPGMYQSPVIHPSPSSYPYPPPQPSQRYYQPPPPLPPTPTAPAHAYIPRTPGMDPSLYANGPSSSPGANYSPHTPTAANRGASSSNYQLQTVVPSSSRALHQQQYMSPSLPSHFDALTTEPPALSQPPMMQSNSVPLEEATHQHVTIYEHGPSEGSQGTTLTIKCDVNFPPSSPDDTSRSPGHQASSSGRALRVVFGQHPVQTQVMVLNNQSTASNGGQMCQLNAVVPSWSSTGASAMGRQNTIPVFVQVLDGSHAIIETVTMGDFSYTNTGSRAYQYNNFNPSSVNPLKRSGEALESHRPSPNDLLHRRVLSSKSNYEHSPEIHQYPQMAPPPAYQSSPNPDGPYSSPYIPSSATMPSAPTLPSNNYPPVPHAVESGAAQPSLMRATQVVPPNINSLPMNPYVMSTSSKASLELTGDLDSMSKGWTQEEWINRRRLVQFWRRQDGTTIFAAFRPLPQQEYPSAQQSIIISCIFREDKNECFVTSVDAIYLLEALVGTRFTVEEKNRIRRNLEGFRPITVSKSKPGSEDFFKLIMGFPNPKPRNIEKDVKVFPWDILGQALKKIIGKYQSASFPYAGPGGSMASSQVTPIPYAPSIMPPPLPVQEPYSQANSACPAPALISHSSSDSSNYGETSSSASTYPSNALPQTPQMTQIAPIPSLPSLASQRQLDDPPHHYRSVSGPVGQQHAVTPTEKSHHANGHHNHSHSYSHTSEFVNMSPSNGEHDHNHSPYAPHHGGYWSGHGNVDPSLTQDHSIGGMNHSGEGRQEGNSHPGSYAMGYNGEPVHQLPHVHETHSRQPSSNDLRVVYPALA